MAVLELGKVPGDEPYTAIDYGLVLFNLVEEVHKIALSASLLNVILFFEFIFYHSLPSENQLGPFIYF